MARRKQGGQAKAERRQTKAERRQAKVARKGRGRGVLSLVTEAPRDREPQASEIERRLAVIEERLVANSEQLEEIAARLARAVQKAGARERSLANLLGVPTAEDSDEGLERALRLRGENAVPVDEPLALICQAQRSGGTLLGRLFDGHPRCHAHPHELHIGDRRPHVWPELRLEEKPEDWFARLREEKVGILFNKGKRRIPLKGPGDRPDEGSYPCLLPPELQRTLFLAEIERRSPIASERQILDAYMTSLFNAWLDNQNLRGGDKRWVVAFSPRRAWGDGLDKFFELYPDGRLISILRDPLSWYGSAQGRDPEADATDLLELWKRSAREMLEAKRRFEERTCIVRFDELLLDTPATMRRLARFLGIEYRRQLTTPTFNGYPVGANSSYEIKGTGVVTDPVERYRDVLSEEQRKLVDGECEELHQEALALVDGRASA